MPPGSCLTRKDPAPTAMVVRGYRDDFGAALARIDALEPKAMAVLPSKDKVFLRLRDSFVSQPERWRRERICWPSYRNSYGIQVWADRDGWVMDMPDANGKRTFGFYRTGFFWIRAGEVERRPDGMVRINTEIWVYIFCPRFRRTIRKYRNWRLLKDLEGK